MPDDNALAADAAYAVNLVGELYRAQELGAAPFCEPPEVIEMITAAERVSRPRVSDNTSTGQGFGLNAVERAVVEKRAMDEAFSWLSSDGFSNLRDVHETKSCDFTADRDAVEHYIEVKGTTSDLCKIILTANEVTLHPTNVLIVVYEIKSMRLGLWPTWEG